MAVYTLSMTHSGNHFLSLCGVQKKIILALYKNCRILGSKTTESLTVEAIAHLANCNKKSVKTSVKRLKEKGFIIIESYKDGRGGWVRYQLNGKLYNDILHYEECKPILTNGTQTEHAT